MSDPIGTEFGIVVDQVSFGEALPDAFQELAEKATQQHIAMIQTPAGYTLAPMKDGEVITPQDFEAMPEDERERSMKVIEELKGLDSTEIVQTIGGVALIYRPSREPKPGLSNILRSNVL